MSGRQPPHEPAINIGQFILALPWVVFIALRMQIESSYEPDPLTVWANWSLVVMVILCSAFWAYRDGHRRGYHGDHLRNHTIKLAMFAGLGQVAVLIGIFYIGCACR